LKALPQVAEEQLRQTGHNLQDDAVDPDPGDYSDSAEDAVPFQYQSGAVDGLTRYSLLLEETAVGILVDSGDSFRLAFV
jgi:hypothetical protein